MIDKRMLSVTSSSLATTVYTGDANAVFSGTTKDR
jgi:hypothetical protein